MPKHGARKRRRSSSSGAAAKRRGQRRRSSSASGRKERRADNGSPPFRRFAWESPSPANRSRSRRRGEKDRNGSKGKGKEKAKGEKEKSGAKDSRQSRRKSSDGSAKASRSRSGRKGKAKKERKEKRDESRGEDSKGDSDGTAKAPSVTASAAGVVSAGGKLSTGGLSLDLAELQKGIEKERSMLQLFVLKAKQEHEEQKETKEKKERREREYFKAEFGEPCGPKNQLLLEEELGKGAFSTVFKCRDVGVSGKEYAIKFIRANVMLRKATEKEIRLMRRLRSEASEQDPEGARCFLGLAGPETFEHSGHLALVFHLQRCDLRSGLQKYGQGRGLPLVNVRSYARDIFMALRALRKVNVIHSDLKPDNLLMSMDKASVKLSDFGSAMDMAERIRTDYVQPRFYRAPEIILGQSYGPPIDIWSAGATVFELATGRILFTGKTNNGMVHEMLKVCGAFTKRFATTGDFAAKHFNSKGDFRLKDASQEPPGETLLPAASFKKPPTPIPQLLADLGKRVPAGTDALLHQGVIRHLADLLGKCVVPDPAERFTPEEVLAHKFFLKTP